MAERKPPAAHIMLGKAMSRERKRITPILSQEKLADKFGYSRSTLANSEAAQQLPSSYLLEKYDEEFETDGYLVDLLETLTSEGTVGVLRPLIKLEEQATCIRTYTPIYMPGPVQTDVYMRDLFEVGKLTIPSLNVAELMKVRKGRQDHLLGPGAPRQHMLLFEAVLHNEVVPREEMHQQMVKLREAMDHPRMLVKILPFTAGKYAFDGLFMTVETPKQSAVYVEGPLEISILTRYDTAVLADSIAKFDLAWAEALSRSDSIAMVDEWIERLEP